MNGASEAGATAQRTSSRIGASRPSYAAAAVLLVAAGLALRLPRWGLPLPVHHYGGGLLWGAAVYALVAAVAGHSLRRPGRLLVAAALIVAVEGSRLVHAPALDAFRATLAGQLLLGRLFSAPNMLVDGLGAAALAAATARWR